MRYCSREAQKRRHKKLKKLFAIMLYDLSFMYTKLPHTGATRHPLPGRRFAAWYRQLAKPISELTSIPGPPNSRSIAMPLLPAWKWGVLYKLSKATSNYVLIQHCRGKLRWFSKTHSSNSPRVTAHLPANTSR